MTQNTNVNAQGAEINATTKENTLNKNEELDEHEEKCPPEYHEEIANFVSYEGSYFKKAFHSKKPFWPEHCVQCQKSFWTGEITITQSKPAMFCPNAGKEHSCVYAFCPPCFKNRLEKGNRERVAVASPVKKALEESTNKRSFPFWDPLCHPRKSARKRIELIGRPLCGETLVNGNIVGNF